MDIEDPVFRFFNAVPENRHQALKPIENGLDVNKRDERGEPLICYAARTGAWEVFEAMLEHGPDPLDADPDGITAFH